MPDWKNLLNEDEWEMLCDNCGLCCLFKVCDEDTGEVFYTSIVCPFLDRETVRCVCYGERFRRMPTCTKVSADSLPEIAGWMPGNCAYRCLMEGISLPDWHPLYSDPSPEAAALLEKLSAVCVRPASHITKEKAEELIRNSTPAKSPRKLTRLLLKHIIGKL